MIKTIEFLLFIKRIFHILLFAKVGDHILFEDYTLSKITSLNETGWPEINGENLDVFDVRRLIKGSINGHKKEIYEGIIQCRETLRELSDWDEDDI